MGYYEVFHKLIWYGNLNINRLDLLVQSKYFIQGFK